MNKSWSETFVKSVSDVVFSYTDVAAYGNQSAEQYPPLVPVPVSLSRYVQWRRSKASRCDLGWVATRTHQACLHVEIFTPYKPRPSGPLWTCAVCSGRRKEGLHWTTVACKREWVTKNKRPKILTLSRLMFRRISVVRYSLVKALDLGGIACSVT